MRRTILVRVRWNRGHRLCTQIMGARACDGSGLPAIGSPRRRWSLCSQAAPRHGSSRAAGTAHRARGRPGRQGRPSRRLQAGPGGAASVLVVAEYVLPPTQQRLSLRRPRRPPRLRHRPARTVLGTGPLTMAVCRANGARKEWVSGEGRARWAATWALMTGGPDGSVSPRRSLCPGVAPRDPPPASSRRRSCCPAGRGESRARPASASFPLGGFRRGAVAGAGTSPRAPSASAVRRRGFLPPPPTPPPPPAARRIHSPETSDSEKEGRKRKGACRRHSIAAQSGPSGATARSPRAAGRGARTATAEGSGGRADGFGWGKGD